MADKTFFSRLTKLFSTAVIINKPGQPRKVLDIDKLQSYSNFETNRVVDKYSGARKGANDYLRYNQTMGYEVNKNELYSEYECLDGDTIIPTPDHHSNKTIRELAELHPTNKQPFYVYSYDHSSDSIKLGTAHSVKKTKTEMTYKIVLDNDYEIIATNNHPFLMRNGEYKQVNELEINDSIMPFYKRDFYGDGYNHIYNFSKKWQVEHRLVCEQFNGDLKKGDVVHHKDFNKNNNLPDNLIRMKDSDHKSYHMTHNNIKFWSPENRDRHIKRIAAGMKKSREQNPEKYIQMYKDHSIWMHENNPFRGKKHSKKWKLAASIRSKQFHLKHDFFGANNNNYRRDITFEKINDAASNLFKNDTELRKYELLGVLKCDNCVLMDRLTKNDINSFTEYKAYISDILNHKIKRIEEFEVRDVYDMTVDTYHNFATEHCFVHNSMDTDPILSSALDIYSDDSTVKNKYQDILEITSPNENVAESLHNLFYDILNIEFNLWTWIRSVCKYGDFYLKLDITENIGVTNVYPLSAYAMSREEDPDNTQLVRFRYDPHVGQNVSYFAAGKDKGYFFENYEIAHFRLIADTNYLPYGRSILEPARKVWKQLVMMEDAMLIHRIMRAPEKRIFKIDIGNIPPNEVDSHMNNIISKLKKVPYMDEQTGQYNLEFNLMNMLEDFYLPVRGSSSGTEIDTLSGMEFTGIEDIEYLRNKMMAALKIPKAFLTYEEEINAKSTLSMEDARFARTVERVQKIVVSELMKIAIVHLYSQGFKNEELVDFRLALTTPSTAIEREKMEVWSEQVNLARDMKELKLLSDEYIYENVFQLSKEQWEEEQENLVKNLKLAFRYSQIEEEGNDPAITMQSAGTETDNQFMKDSINKNSATLHTGNRSELSSKSIASESNFSVDKFLKTLSKKQELISETFREKTIEHSDDGTFLDENNIINEPKEKKKGK